MTAGDPHIAAGGARPGTPPTGRDRVLRIAGPALSNPSHQTVLMTDISAAATTKAPRAARRAAIGTGAPRSAQTRGPNNQTGRPTLGTSPPLQSTIQWPLSLARGEGRSRFVRADFLMRLQGLFSRDYERPQLMGHPEITLREEMEHWDYTRWTLNFRKHKILAKA